MLKILIAAGLIVLVLFILFLLSCIGVLILMLYIILTTREPKTDVSARTPMHIASPGGDPQFRRLADEAKAYAARPSVTTFLDADKGVLLTTVADPFDRRVYAFSTRRDGKVLKSMVCVYEDGRYDPVARAEIEVPVSQVDWNAYHEDLKDIADNGSTMLFKDEDGRARSVRFPKRRKGRHHA
jgi:hypothetical protein